MTNKSIKRILVLVIVVALIYLTYRVDRKYFMANRVLHGAWIYSSGFYIGDFLQGGSYSIKDEEIVFYEDGYHCKIIGAYFDLLIIKDDESGNWGYYVK